MLQWVSYNILNLFAIFGPWTLTVFSKYFVLKFGMKYNLFCLVFLTDIGLSLLSLKFVIKDSGKRSLLYTAMTHRSMCEGANLYSIISSQN